MSSADELLPHLMRRLEEVRRTLGWVDALPADGRIAFADVIDSMGLVEFLSLLADDCGTTAEALERATGRRFGTVADLAETLARAGIRPTAPAARPVIETTADRSAKAWLSAMTYRLPATVQTAAQLNDRLQRPPGWLEARAGIVQRRLWGEEDALTATAANAADALRYSGATAAQVGALLVTAEAPPLPVGLAAEMHRRLGLPAHAVALEIGGACTGFLAALWTGLRLFPTQDIVLLIAVEAPSQWLETAPGPAGEAAALFGDATAACVLSREPIGPRALPLREVSLGVDPAGAQLVQVERSASGRPELAMDGPPLASWAVQALARIITEMTDRHEVESQELAGVVIHGGNGRLPGLLARRLRLPEERVLSETARTGNLGSASLPVAWTVRAPGPGPIVWAAVGAGGLWGAALTG